MSQHPLVSTAWLAEHLGDADLVIFDPTASGRISASTHHQKVDRNIYEGFARHGRVTHTIAAGQNLMTLVSLEGVWVTANFKETQLRQVKAGQKVEVSVDSTGRKYKAHVTQIGGATGSVLSLFPPENATGNYVKVVQRVPVRIDFDDLKNEDPDHQLRPGLSVEPKVSVK